MGTVLLLAALLLVAAGAACGGGDTSDSQATTREVAGDSATEEPTPEPSGDSATEEPTPEPSGDSATEEPTPEPSGDSATEEPTPEPSGDSATEEPTPGPTVARLATPSPSPSPSPTKPPVPTAALTVPPVTSISEALFVSFEYDTITLQRFNEVLVIEYDRDNNLPAILIEKGTELLDATPEQILPGSTVQVNEREEMFTLILVRDIPPVALTDLPQPTEAPPVVEEHPERPNLRLRVDDAAAGGKFESVSAGGTGTGQDHTCGVMTGRRRGLLGQ